MSTLAIGAAILLGLLAALKYIAPKTKNTLDDKVEGALEAAEPILEKAAKGE